MKFKFTSSLFRELDDTYPELQSIRAFTIANALVADWLKDAVRVYGCNDTTDDYVLWRKCKDGIASHQALLINIEPIEKPKHEHTPIIVYQDDSSTKWHCSYCGIKLKATFSEDK